MSEDNKVPAEQESEKHADFVTEPLSDDDLEDVSGGMLAGDCADGIGSCCNGSAFDA